MSHITPYLFFDGKCHEAMEFYKSCFGGDLTMSRYADGRQARGAPKVKASLIWRGSCMPALRAATPV